MPIEQILIDSLDNFKKGVIYLVQRVFEKSVELLTIYTNDSSVMRSFDKNFN